MSMAPAFSVFLPDEAATTRLAEAFSAAAGPGSVFLLSGPIGAGKSHFARAFIRARLGPDTDVPSPTFTLVQSYETPSGEIWHADLYRLSHSDEVIELGLDAAFAGSICLIEWPDRLGSLSPPGALHLEFEPWDEGRRVTLSPGSHPLISRAEIQS